MAVLATDDFVRADNPDLGADWTPNEDSFKIASNRAAPNNTGNDAIERYSAIVWPDDQYVQAALFGVASGGGGSGSGIGLSLRCDTGGALTCYRIVVNAASPQVEIGKFIASVYTTITTRVQAFAEGDTLRCEAQGTTFRLYRNGVQLGADITDAAIGSGAVGVANSGPSPAGAGIATWEGGDFAPSGPQNQLAWIRA